ncbi:MAG: fumarylacetoacetate hydrolase family protein [Prevotella sp.]|nr:fumarylacetoacetate hydrolase family protein [Prevotella sp.]
MKIFGVGMNYLQHNKELDGALYKPEEPVIFTKADSALLKNGKPFFVPDWASRVDYEAEVVVRICRLGKGIPVRFAHRYYDAVTVGIDFTVRDWQQRARQNGLPWTICKGFDGSAAIGEWVELPMAGGTTALPGGVDVQDLHLRLDIDGKTVQEGHTADMLYTVDELIAYISRFFTLRTGDLLYTGTPAGVGPVAIDNHLEGWLEGRKVLDFFCK